MKRKISIISLIILLSIGLFKSSYSQNVGINTTGATPSTNAILDLNTGNSNNLGLIIPSVTLGASLATFTPPMVGANTANDVGMLVYNSSAANQPKGYYYWNGSDWTTVSNGWSLTGNSGTTPSTSAIGVTANNNFLGTFDLNDFVIASDNLERMRISSAGNIGINTIAPGALFDVEGVIAANANCTTGNLVTINGSLTTSGTALNITTGKLTIGSALSVASTSTADNGSKLLNLSSNGVNGASAMTTYGVYSSITNTNGTSGTNVAGYFSASGANMTNNAIVVPSGGGNVGIGTTNPASSAIIDLTNTNAFGGTGAPILWPTNPNPSANIANPVLGEEVFNTTTGCFNFYDGAVNGWLLATCPCGAAPTTPAIAATCSEAFIGSVITYTTATTGAVYDWTVSGQSSYTAGTALTNSVVVTWPGSPGSGTVNLTVTNPCGSATAATQNVTIYADPTISGTTPIYTGSSGNSFTCSIAGATYAWSITANTASSSISGSATGQSVSITAGGTAGSFTLNCLVSFGSCSYNATYAVSVSNCTVLTGVNPTMGSSACASANNVLSKTGSAVTYTVTAVAGATGYTWNNSNNAVFTISSSGTSCTVTPAGAGTATLSVTATDACTSSNIATVTIKVITSAQGFAYSASVQTFKVPDNITTMTITAIGANGGKDNGAVSGGYGAKVLSGSITVTCGEILDIVTGGAGSNGGGGDGGGGGGGGTFVWNTASVAVPLVVAGGGGGGTHGGGTGGDASTAPGAGGGGAAGADSYGGGGGGYTGGSAGNGTSNSGGVGGGSGWDNAGTFSTGGGATITDQGFDASGSVSISF